MNLTFVNDYLIIQGHSNKAELIKNKLRRQSLENSRVYKATLEFVFLVY